MSPSLQYVTTEDGYRIAYTVAGKGPPVLFRPCLLQSDILEDSDGLHDFLAGMTKRFQVIRYDGRGTGNSTRGLSASLELEDTLRDATAVVEALQLRDFVLYSDVFDSYTALLLAIRIPHLVRAVVLVSPIPFDGEKMMPAWAQMYEKDWAVFTNTFASTFVGEGVTGEYVRRRVDHTDFVRLATSAEGRYLNDILKDVVTPTLVLGNKEPVNPKLRDAARQIASGVRYGKLLFFDGDRVGDILAPEGDPEPALKAIEDFLAEIDSRSAVEETARTGANANLSARETEVLRLVAAGRSNQQIAQDLFISASTVGKHITSILGKTEARNRAEAAVYAHKHGLI